MNIKTLVFFVDISSIYFGFVVSFWLRFHPRSAARIFFVTNFSVIPILISIYFIVLILSGIYQKNTFSSKIIFSGRLFKALSMASLAGMSFLYVFREKLGNFPSSIFLISFPIIFLLLVSAKLIIYKLYSNT